MSTESSLKQQQMELSEIREAIGIGKGPSKSCESQNDCVEGLDVEYDEVL